MGTATRRTISDGSKAKAVKAAFSGTDVATLSKRLKVSASSIYLWAQDPRFGGDSGGIAARTHPDGGKSASGNGLATRVKAADAKSSYRKPRTPVATQHACPWCGGPLKVTR